MSKRLNRTCICCGTNYRYCNRCAEDAGKPSWLRNFHDENCRKIFYVVNDFNHGEITASDAAKILKNCDLSNKRNFKESIANIIDKIMETAAPKPRVKKASQARKELSDKTIE